MDSSLIEIDDSDNPEKKVYHLFGHDIRRIPCLRSAGMTTLSLGLGATLVQFLFTSDGMKASRVGLFTMTALLTPLWLHCAWKDYNDAEAIRATQMRLKERANEQFTLLDSLESHGSDSYG